MSKQNVSGLYDQLSSMEHLIKSASTYPIHKRLNFASEPSNDIYEWIVNVIGLPNQGLIIDAGCGTGWGCQFISKHSKAAILGVSLSEQEIELADKALKTNENTLKNIHFKQQSFDELPTDSADLIIAVESIKHSQDIRLSIENMLAALRPNGKLIIVDDFYCEQTFSQDATQYMQDWHLYEMLSVQHIQALKNSLIPIKIPPQIIDHTFKMHIPMRAWSSMKTFVCNAILRFRKNDLALRAFKGGFILDKLYAEQKMKYLAVVLVRQ